MPTIGHRAIVTETPLYSLLMADNMITPGFGEVIPHISGNKKQWVLKVEKHLRAFSDRLNMTGVEPRDQEITYQPFHRFSYYYQGGNVEVWPDEGRIGIELTHPKRDEVIQGLIKLLFITRKNGMQSRSPSITNLIVNA